MRGGAGGALLFFLCPARVFLFNKSEDVMCYMDWA